MFKYAPKFRIAIAQLMYDQTKNPFWKIKAYKLQGEAYWDMGKQSQTFDHYNLGIKLGDTLVEEMKTDPTINFGMAYLYSSLALKSKSKMHIDESLKFFEQGIRVSKSEVDLSKIKKFTDKLILLKKEIDEKKYPENQLDLHLRAKS